MPKAPQSTSSVAIPKPSGVLKILPADRADKRVVWRSYAQGEYMSILFLLWDDETGRTEIEERGLFHEALKNAMAFRRQI